MVPGTCACVSIKVMFQYYHHVVVVLGTGFPVRHNLGTKPTGSSGY